MGTRTQWDSNNNNNNNSSQINTKNTTVLVNICGRNQNKQKNGVKSIFSRTKPNDFISVYFGHWNKENANVHSKKAFVWQNMVDFVHLTL